MPHLSAEPVVMTPAHEQVLIRLVRAHTTPRKLAERAQLILLAAAGPATGDIHARADLRDCCIGLRATSRSERSAPEPLEPQ